MNPGDEVRLRHNPTRRGVLQRATTRSGRRYWLVGLGGERPNHVPESQLELVPEGPVTPLDLLATGEFAAPSELRRLLTHVRVAGHPADMLYSMEATNTDFKAYQFKPVIKIIESPTGRVLLADEVGLGKTIEAGLIWTELRSRFDARRLLVLCPKALREKWRRELFTKFGIEATITDAPGLLERLRARSTDAPFSLIASFSSLIPRERSGEAVSPTTTPAHALQRHLANAENYPCFDFLAVDEAHHGRNPQTRTHQLIKVAVEISKFSALLSATPVHNRQQDLLSLLHLLDPDTFADPDVLDIIRAANEPLIRARDALRRPSTDPGELTAHLDAASAHPLLKKSEQLRLIRRNFEDIPTALASAEQRSDFAHRLERVNLLGHAISRTRRRDVEENRAHRELVTQPVAMNEREREYYELVTAAVREYADEHETVQAFLLSQPQRQMASCFAASAARFSGMEIEGLPDTAPLPEDDESSDDIARPLIAHLRQSTRSWLAASDGDASRLILLRKEDTKYDLLVENLREYSRKHTGSKLVLFSTFRATIGYLSARLTEDGFANTILQGGQKRSVDEVLADFQADDGPNLLLSTEVGAEGVDLQFCRLLVNYDLPWNPMRVEQRIGRLDRIGQTADKIVIWTLLHKDTIDSRIHEILFEKLEIFRQYLGDCEEVVAEEVRKLTSALLSERLNAEQQSRRIEQTAYAIETRRKQEQELEDEAPGLTAYGDYILDRVSDAKDRRRWLSPEDIDTYVTENLRRLFPGTRVYRNRNGRDGTALAPGSDRVAELDLSAGAHEDFSNFLRDNRLRTNTRLATSTTTVRCRFANRTEGRRAVHEEVITQFHAITRFIAHLLDDPERERHLRTVVAARLPAAAARDSGAPFGPGAYLLVVSSARFDGLRKTTYIKYAAERFDPAIRQLRAADAERLAAAVIMRGESWLAARGEVDSGLVRDRAERLFLRLERQFEAVREEEQAANDDRVRFQVSAIDRQTRRRKAVLSPQVRRHRDQAAEHRAHGRVREAALRENLAKGAATRLRNETESLERRRERLKANHRVRPNPPEELAVAVIRVGE